MNKYRVILLNPYIPPSAVYRYGYDIFTAVENAKLFTFVNNGKSIPPQFSEGSFISGGFKIIETLNKLLPNLAYKPFVNSIKGNKNDDLQTIIHYVAPMNRIKFPEFVNVVTFHDPISMLLETSMFGEGNSKQSYKDFLKKIFQRRYLNSFKKFYNILCDTEYVKSILTSEGFSDCLRVIYPAIPPVYRPLRNKEVLRQKLNLPENKKLILSVSSNLKRKNLSKVRETMLLLGDDYKLVRVGKSIMEGDISFQGVNYDIMNEIYNACDAMLFPSLYEGFGYPLVEAFSSGLPVVASDIEVFRELAAGAAILTSPNDVSDLVLGVKSAIENSEKHRMMGLKRAERFSFDRFGSEINEYYSSVLD